MTSLKVRGFAARIMCAIRALGVAGITTVVVPSYCFALAGFDIGETEPAWLAEVQKEAESRGFEAPAVLLRTERLETSLPVEALVVEIIGVAPPPQFVVLDSGSGWSVVLAQKGLTEGWVGAVESMLGRLPPETSPADIAQGISRLLVDPEDRFGKVIGAWSEIPTDDELSDVYRDYRDVGCAVALRAKMEGAEAVYGALSPPVSRETKDGTELAFFTWGFFGGVVREWRIIYGSDVKASIRTELVAGEIGSYKFYY